MSVAALLVSVGFGLIVATVIQLEMNRPKVDVDDWYAYVDRVYRETKADDRALARRSNTDTGLIRPYLAEARDQMRADTEAAKTRAAVETLLAAWQPVEGSPLRWSLEWLARNTDRTTNA
ncbi:hypothetical protein G6009_00855 [Dietzia sp. SLG510A3-30A2]|nr:hypothetical protein [Dietzia sp. SLG510A3-30A2]